MKRFFFLVLCLVLLTPLAWSQTRKPGKKQPARTTKVQHPVKQGKMEKKKPVAQKISKKPVHHHMIKSRSER